MKIITDSQRKIIDAFFLIAKEQPNQRITFQMLADQSGMRRESIYRYHFSNLEELIEKVHDIIDNEISSAFEEFVNNGDLNLLKFLSYLVLPCLYEKKDWLKILYGTNVDPGWSNFLEERYFPLIECYLNKKGKNDIIPNFFLSKVIVKEFLAIVAVWLTDDNPEPASLFQRKFVHIFQQSPAAMLTYIPSDFESGKH